MPTLTTLVNFNSTNGYGPIGGLIADAAGGLFGATEYGAAGYTGGYTGDGTVLELTGTGFQGVWPEGNVKLAIKSYALAGLAIRGEGHAANHFRTARRSGQD
jgi:hypothetical protein